MDIEKQAAYRPPRCYEFHRMVFLIHRPWRGTACFVTALCAFRLSLTLAGASDLWQRQSIYQIITDRFFDGDSANNNADGNFDPSGRGRTSVHGGDFNGIEQKLDYIQALGATAICPLVTLS